MYETGGNGLVPKDLAMARKLYAAAAGHGMKEAQARLDAAGPGARPHGPGATARLMQPRARPPPGRQPRPARANPPRQP